MIDFFRTFGPWGLVLLSMAWLLKVMVADKLSSMMDTLEVLLSGQKNHSDRLTRIETVLEMNGCLDGEPVCRKRVN
jgi:hypothetical protein